MLAEDAGGSVVDWSLLSWCLAAAIAVGLAFGAWRVGPLVAEPLIQTASRGVDGSVATQVPGLINRTAELETEVRRLTEEVRRLTAERERIRSRVDTIEGNVNDVAVALSQGSTTLARASVPTAPAAAAPVATQPGDPGPATTATVPVRPGPVPVPAARPLTAATPEPAAAPSGVTWTQFGVDIGSEATMKALRGRWTAVRGKHGDLLAEMRPIVTVRDNGRGGSELRLVAGPLDDAAAAARLCAALSSAGQFCMPTVYDGQRLGLP